MKSLANDSLLIGVFRRGLVLRMKKHFRAILAVTLALTFAASNTAPALANSNDNPRIEFTVYFDIASEDDHNDKYGYITYETAGTLNDVSGNRDQKADPKIKVMIRQTGGAKYGPDGNYIEPVLSSLVIKAPKGVSFNQNYMRDSYMATVGTLSNDVTLEIPFYLFPVAPGDYSFAGEFPMAESEFKFETNANYPCVFPQEEINGKVIDGIVAPFRVYKESNESRIYNLSGESVNPGWAPEEFSKQSNSYSQYMARLSAGLSAAAYNDVNLKTSLLNLGFSRIIDYNYGKPSSWDADTVAYEIAQKKLPIGGGRYNTIVVLAIRGTEGPTEWLSNFKVNRSYAPVIGAYHSGFEAAYKEALGSLTNYISSYVKASRSEVKLLITGHSRGAAVANLLAADLNQSQSLATKSNIFCYTFACPNGYKGLSDKTELYTNIFNINNNFDAINAAAPSVLGYGRFGDNRYFNVYKKSLVEAHSMVNVYLQWMYSHETPAGFVPYSNETSVLESILALAVLASYLPRIDTIVRIVIECPVDVEVYGSGSRLIGKITNDEPSYSESDPIAILVDGDSGAKVIYAPAGEEITLKLTAADGGAMTCTSTIMDGMTMDTVSETVFRNVALEKGKGFVLEDVSAGAKLFVTLGGVKTEEIAPSAFGANGTEFQLNVNSRLYTLNGTEHYSDAAPYIQAPGRTMVPLRLISEAMGAVVNWYGETRTATVLKDGIELRLTVGEELPGGMGKPELITIIDENGMEAGGRVMVPLRYVSEELGASVQWTPPGNIIILW